ncbi:MAG TPA: ribosome biogenesis GTP-binding protein YihA/YsxC [Acidobacteriota bacterium]|nr:ribosome biogenesis GTP-binding protein YihA/YsxC [Acidobacteriota bacterium]
MIHSEFVVSAFSERDFPREGIPEVVIAGRSNVGKSSLINQLAGNRSLARTSSTPGKTQSINFYRFEQAFFLVDLPGFGYAKAGRAVSRMWKQLIEQYFRDRSTISLVFQLVDARLRPTALDLELAEWLDYRNIPRVVVATKSDKLSGNDRVVQSRVISNTLGGEPAIMSSAVTGAGCMEIWRRVTETIRKS